MVLQRTSQRAVVWGYSDTSNTPITLTMNNKDYQTMSAPSLNTNEASIWSVTLDAQPEEGPFDVKVTQSLPNGTLITIVLHDVLFGDVIHLQEWLSKEPFGEQNTYYNRDIYNCAFPKMIQAWRNVWHTRTNASTDPAFPFGFVQLSTDTNNSAQVGGFPWIRWHQTFDVGSVPNNVVPNVFMVVALDLRDDEHGVHPRDKLDVGYRLSRSGLAVAYDYQNVTYLGPIIANIVVASDSSKVNVTYSNVASPSIELRNPNGFEVCCAGSQVCSTNDGSWVATPASRIEGSSLTISLSVPSSCASKPINGFRYLWRETPCPFKEAAVYNSVDSDLPAPPYIHYF